jgi:hypothetical protein
VVTPRAAALAAALGVAAASAAAAQDTSPVLIDRHLTVGAGATLITTFGEAIARAENAVVPHRLFEDAGVARQAANVSFRLGRFVFFDSPQEQLLMVLNHELFGHGARVRERFDGPIGYRIHTPAPYGQGGASTTFVFDRAPSVHERLSIHAAGMEANAVAADVLASRAIARGGMTPRDAMRYLRFELDTFTYVLSTDEHEEPGHDVADFISVYNGMAVAADAPPLSRQSLRRSALTSLANPMLAYALWGVGRYVATGATDAAVPMLAIGGVRYLPLVRFRLTPFGSEWAIVNELSGARRATQVELRIGRSLHERPWGIAVRQDDVADWREWALALAAGAWRQPRFAETASDPVMAEAQVGGYVRGRLERPLLPVWFSTDRAGIIVDVGLKSAGYVPGEPLGAGLNVRAGVGLPLAR